MIIIFGRLVYNYIRVTGVPHLLHSCVIFFILDGLTARFNLELLCYSFANIGLHVSKTPPSGAAKKAQHYNTIT